MTLEEFYAEIDKRPLEDLVVRLKFKYDWETVYTESNEILEVSEDCDYIWLNDWNEGQTDVEVLGYIPLADVKILPQNVTNGEVIRELFKDYQTNLYFNVDWWNSPYKRG